MLPMLRPGPRPCSSAAAGSCIVCRPAPHACQGPNPKALQPACSTPTHHLPSTSAVAIFQAPCCCTTVYSTCSAERSAAQHNACQRHTMQ